MFGLEAHLSNYVIENAGGTEDWIEVCQMFGTGLLASAFFGEGEVPAGPRLPVMTAWVEHRVADDDVRYLPGPLPTVRIRWQRDVDDAGKERERFLLDALLRPGEKVVMAVCQ